ncbi:hypothetical protein QBC40DRAFT_172508 [Triangularia verruculosa]|uniref:C2H2-type domain-containing protein n=1 Tax=Triangularia verruculosa TaxID=2587418 RepID=A0AAN6XIM8_9PEZI|nr:hypothetical protein QBC40DRAFT_172508 [Triangularia verruculosa]
MSGQTPQTFAELAASGSIGGWPFGRRDNSASSATPAKEDPTPPAGLDPDLPRVTSDLLPPRVATESPAGQTKSTKYSTEDERRKAISEALKRRHASAANDPSHGRNKRVQTANFQGSLLSLPPQSGGPTTQRQSRPEESASTSSESDSSDVEMMDQLPLVLPDDSNDGDWEEGSQRSDASVDDLPDSQLQTEATEVAATVARRALTNTPSGRPYLRWKGEAMHGALIPDEYEWSPALPGFPWICPVRSCRKLFPGIKQLGGHFVRQHRGCLFHDNMDGTLSLRGTYAKLRDGEGAPADGIPKPGTVISIGALDPTEPPMAAPSLPEQGRHHLGTNQSYSENGSEHSAAQSPAPTLAKASSFMPSADSGFELAEPGRKYTEWPEEGGPRSVYGVLIPAGYTMSRVQGEKPFRCPVRNCPKGCGKLNDLGFHFIVARHTDIRFFQRGHYASYLRDRGDGSFDVVGEYAPKRGNIVRSGKIVNPGPPIVVARTRPDGSTEWVPNWENMKRLSQDNDVTAAIPDKTSDVPMDDEVPADAVSNSTPDMTPGMVQGSGVPAEAVPVWPQSTWGQMEVKPEHVQAAQRLWHQKVLPALPGAPSVPQQTVVVELLQWKQQRELHPRPNTVTNELHGVKVREIVATDMRYHPPQDTLANTRPQIMADVAGLEQTEEGPSTRYQLRTRSAATGYVYTQPPPQPSEALPVAEQPASDVEKHPQQQPPASLISKGEAPDGAVAASGLVIPEAVLEMEEWEVAPGRIREQDPSPETIAFSKSYLSSAHAVDVHEDVAFRVDTIKSGHSFKIEADSHQLRLCSLASGKLRVKIGDEPEFVIGPHGMFKIKAGSSCNVSNRMYIDAILHSTVLNGFV